MKDLLKFVRCHLGAHVPSHRVDPKKSRMWCCDDCGKLVRSRLAVVQVSAAVSMICSDRSQMNFSASAAR